MTNWREWHSLATRAVQALEKLAGDVPESIEYERGAPFCPACGTFDPNVRTREYDAEGLLSRCAIEAVCLSCNAPIFVVIDSFSMHTDRQAALAELEQQEGKFNGTAKDFLTASGT